MMNTVFFVISNTCLEMATDHANAHMKYMGYTSKIEIVNYGKTKSMLNLIAIKWHDDVVTRLFTQFSEYVYNVNFDHNGFESITSKKRRSFIDTDTVSMILTIVNNTIRTKLLDEIVFSK